MKTINCQEALRAVFEYLDGELTPDDAEAVKYHFDVCRRCYPHLAFTASFHEALHRAAQGQPPCPTELRDKVALLLAQET